MFGFHDGSREEQPMLAYFAVMTARCTIRNMFTALLGSTLAATGLVATSSPAHAETVTVSTISCTNSTSGPLTSQTGYGRASIFTAPITGTLDSIDLAVNKSGNPSEDLIVRVVPATFVVVGDLPTPLNDLTVLGQTELNPDGMPDGFNLDINQLSRGAFTGVQVEAGTDYAVLFGSASNPYGTPSSAAYRLFAGDDCEGGARAFTNAGSTWDVWFSPAASALLTLTFSPSGGAAAQSQVPAPWLKAIGRTPDAECPEGTAPSWAQWPNEGTGGFTCEWREEYAGSFRWTERPGFYN